MEVKEFKNGLSFITFENQKIPEFKQVRGKEWVYWGEDNNYPDYLIDLYMRSSTHNAIITGKVNYIIGNGWKANKSGLTTPNEAILNKFISKINPDQTLNELCEPVILDFEIFNGIALEVIWNKGKTDFELHHVPFNKLRPNEDETIYYYSKNWEERTQSEEKTGLKEYKAFDFAKKENGIFVYKITAPRKGKDPNVFPMPEYIGSTQAIETDLECSNYNLSEIKTGFSAGTMIDFYNGTPEADKKREIEKQIRDKFTGTDRAGQLILNFAQDKDHGSEVKQLSGNDLDKRYIELKKDVRQEIFTGHKVSSPMLFGVKTEGQLGGRTEIAEAYELFQNTYISKRQAILEKVFNSFAKLKKLTGNLKLQPTSAINTNVFSEATIVANLPAKAVQDLIAERMGIDLTKYEDVGVTTTTERTETQMSAQDFEFKLIEAFGKVGRKRELFEVIKSKEFFYTDKIALLESELLCFKDDRDDDLDRAPKLPTRMPIDDFPKNIQIEVLYSYELRSNAPALLPGGTSREFCTKMIEQDFLYTRQEIDNLSNEFGTPVWKYKGGWYTNPNTDAPTPQCRHIWKQNVVKRK